ncbi:MAG: hypothetical protein AAF938_10295 [Myxococcota bacterium]
MAEGATELDVVRCAFCGTQMDVLEGRAASCPKCEAVWLAAKTMSELRASSPSPAVKELFHGAGLEIDDDDGDVVYRASSQDGGHGACPVCESGLQVVEEFSITHLSCPDGHGAYFPAPAHVRRWARWAKRAGIPSQPIVDESKKKRVVVHTITTIVVGLFATLAILGAVFIFALGACLGSF